MLLTQLCSTAINNVALNPSLPYTGDLQSVCNQGSECHAARDTYLRLADAAESRQQACHMEQQDRKVSVQGISC